MDQIKIILELVGLPNPTYGLEIDSGANNFLKTLGDLKRVDFFQHFCQIHNIEGVI
jgi:hypothetical protein